MKSTNIFFATLIISIYHLNPLRSQNFELLHSVNIPEIHTASIDNKDYLYLSDNDGNIRKYNFEGVLSETYSPQKSTQIHTLDVSYSLKIFLFYRDYQEVVILDRFLSETAVYNLKDFFDGYAGDATMANDNNLWIFDENDISIKKINLQVNNVVIKTPLDILISRQLDVTFMKEYHNKLYVGVNGTSVIVFDNLGNYEKNIPAATKYFNFIENELYFLKDKQLVFINLYNQNKRKINLPEVYLYALIAGDKIAFFKVNKLEIYRFK